MSNKWGGYMIFKNLEDAIWYILQLEERGTWNGEMAEQIKDLVSKARDLAAVHYIHVRDGDEVDAVSAKKLIPYP